MSRCNKPGNFLIRSFCVLLWLQFMGVLPSLGQNFEDRLPTLNELRERFSAAGLVLGQEIGALDYQTAGSRYPGQIEDLSNDKLLFLAYSFICLIVVSPIDLFGTFTILSKERSSLF